MRFVADGPSIPDELLVARDEGTVIFFCGAGVSRARADLPGFFGLADKVVKILGAAADGPAHKIIAHARELESKPGLGGLISADRVFGLLEREFRSSEVAEAVAQALKPSSSADLSAHRTVLDLARGPDGNVRLVTTNFDLLFELCDPNLPRSQPPRLPDPSRPDELVGITHLHGRVNETHTGAHGDCFVLSSAEFGRAYLSEGWATEFVRSILSRYVVVFLGYTADDPPVQYLLEALNRSLKGRRGRAYAFQAGSANEAKSKWSHRGVEAISYDGDDGHRTLWSSLEAWATRARDPEAWYDATIALARKGPTSLSPCERGQVAHVVSALQGAKKFVTVDPPPAQWLCVFDPAIRFSKPQQTYGAPGKGEFINPFNCFSLDSDPAPPDIGPDDYFARRDVPEGAWNCFFATELDRENLTETHFAALRGHWSNSVPRLPPRLSYIASWIANVACEPAAVWWAAHQTALHPDLQASIVHQIERAKKPIAPEIRRAWQFLIEAWEARSSSESNDYYQLRSVIQMDGWTEPTVRRLARLQRAYVKSSCVFGSPLPPNNSSDVGVQDMIKVEIEYPHADVFAETPNAHLVAAARYFRNNLEHAVTLELELGGFGLHNLCPIERGDEHDGDSFNRTYGIAPTVFAYLRVLSQLAEVDRQAAKNETLAWWKGEPRIFGRLRIWAAGQPSILSAVEAGHSICILDNEAFWDNSNQRDLLLNLAKRWAHLPDAARNRIGQRLLRGPQRWKDEKKSEHRQRRAWNALNRISWLASRGCQFNFDIDTEISRLRREAPDWQPAYGKRVADSRETKAGWVRTETAYAALLKIPLSQVLQRAAELSGRSNEHLVTNDPFAGLAEERPVRAVGALLHSAARGEYPEWAWRTFLAAKSRASDKQKFKALLAERIAAMPSEALFPILYSVSEWLLASAEDLLTINPRQFELLWNRLLSAFVAPGTHKSTSIVRGTRPPDWATEALNSPVGKLMEALMKDPAIKTLHSAKGFPPVWIDRVNQLFALQGDQRRHALVLFAFNLSWAFSVDPQWTEQNILCIFEGNEDDQDAVWSGFFWGAKVPSRDLYIRIKPYLLGLAANKRGAKRDHSDMLASILLGGWGSIDDCGERCVTNEELRNALLNADEGFRTHTLWQLERWSEDEEGWSDKRFEFLSIVWPRQRQAKTSQVSARLCDLAFADPAAFPRLVDLIIPLVTTVDRTTLRLSLLRREGENIVDRHPASVLTLLHAVLPENAAVWPYDIEHAIDRIGTADPSLLTDKRMLELRRRWNSR